MTMTVTYQNVQGAYPQTVTLLNGEQILLRPMEARDADALLDFFRELSEGERFFMKEDVTSAEVVHRWAEELDYERALPLLAFAGLQVVADAVLLRSRAAARRHVGEIRLAIRPNYRDLGLGTVMMQHLMTLANRASVEILTFEAVRGIHDEAIRSAQWLGFAQTALLKGRAKDHLGAHHDVIVMEALLGKWFEWWPFRMSICKVHFRFPW